MIFDESVFIESKFMVYSTGFITIWLSGIFKVKLFH